MQLRRILASVTQGVRAGLLRALLPRWIRITPDPASEREALARHPSWTKHPARWHS